MLDIYGYRPFPDVKAYISQKRPVGYECISGGSCAVAVGGGGGGANVRVVGGLMPPQLIPDFTKVQCAYSAT